MPTNSYDLIVVGSDFAGLVAGTLCARRGMRVLLLDHDARPMTYALGSHQLPVEPLCLAGLSSPCAQRVLDELQLGHTLRRKQSAGSVPFQFATAAVRVNLSADEHVLAQELRRELPEAMYESPADATAEAAAQGDVSSASGDDESSSDEQSNSPLLALPAPMSVLEACERAAELSAQFDAAMSASDEFPPTGFWKRRELGKSAQRLSEDAESWWASASAHPAVAAMLSLPAVLGTGALPDDLGAASLARSFHLWRTGAAQLPESWETLCELLRERLTKASGETRAARAEAFTYRWGRINGVRLEGGEELGTSYVIAALPLAELLPLVGDKLPKRLLQCADEIEPAGYRYTWNLVVDGAGVPEGMSSPLLLCVDPSAPLAADNAMGVYLGAPDDEGHVIVTISSVCPMPPEGQPLERALAELRARMRERLDVVMPFLDEHIVVSHSPHDAAAPEGIHAAAASGLPIAPAAVWHSTLESAMGVSAVPTHVGIKNLAVASSQVLPRLGLEGDLAAAWSAAKQASEALGKKREYREVLANG
ncbi:NAD(P)-binding protein [Haliangium ochraceum]|uniref:FAD dependent oxidoreductase n=1 Tax=Haliangium ochraceum (strain DSM 14365 / JCM 11303 / SMP-2) TaxID=502025 RepID=D0LYB1_HALO1|nr:FAD/NAD(P)-binding protein [Haliangium ochraceum]ACY16261.1 hypothetical protein Hoch_3761 [Haliangium ochraceum DSM 14365]